MIFIISKPFEVIFSDFLLKNKNQENQFLRGEPCFSKTNNYLCGREPTMVLLYLDVYVMVILVADVCISSIVQ